jgi:hypothetical protein
MMDPSARLQAVRSALTLGGMTSPTDTTRFTVEPVPSGRFWMVRDTEGSALRFNGRPTSVIGWEGLDEPTARRIAARYNDGWRPVD